MVCLVMAFGKCPLCGTTYHINVNKIDWSAQRGLQPGDFAPDICWFCAPEIAEGDLVQVRRDLAEPATRPLAGKQGRVERILSKEDGPLYCVRLDNGESWFARCEIQKPPKDGL